MAMVAEILCDAQLAYDQALRPRGSSPLAREAVLAYFSHREKDLLAQLLRVPDAKFSAYCSQHRITKDGELLLRQELSRARTHEHHRESRPSDLSW